jgi:nickel-dependent lactate racemase
MMISRSYTDKLLTKQEIEDLVTQAFQTWDMTKLRVLVIIPDSTRTMPMPLFFRLFHKVLGSKVAVLDYLVALGTHPRMSDEALYRLVGISSQERASQYAKVGIFNHRWDLPDTFVTLGTISTEETRRLSRGMLSLDVPVRINRMILDYDVILVCGPVFPHEVVGISGGSKYFFPGIGGPELINFTHWLGALITSYAIIGKPHTPVREVIEKATSLIPRPRLYFCSVVKNEGLAGLFIGETEENRPGEAWMTAADLSSRLHVRYVEQPFRQVLSVIPTMYDDLWTGAKGMYKVEPVVAEDGEIVLYAPHISEISYSHGNILAELGYHVRDYYVKQWDRFKAYPWGLLAHSTHLRGMGTFESGIEKPRIRVTLATSIPAEKCNGINLGYRDPTSIHQEDWVDRESDGVLWVPHAGETLYRLKEQKENL